MANRPTPGNDEIRGTNLADNIDALAGNDTIFGLEGDDTLSGGAGSDEVFGGIGRGIFAGEDNKDAVISSTTAMRKNLFLSAYSKDQAVPL